MPHETVSRLTRTAIGVLVIILTMNVSAVGLPSDLTSNMQRPPSRFQILEEYRGEGVLDSETRLIWERSAGSAATGWANASLRCALSTAGGRLGWRLPSFFELMTLVEPASQVTANTLRLPADHPFRGVKADIYWTTSSQDSEPGSAYAVDFLRGDVTSQRKNQSHAWWCVRGGTSNAPATGSSNPLQDSI